MDTLQAAANQQQQQQHLTNHSDNQQSVKLSIPQIPQQPQLNNGNNDHHHRALKRKAEELVNDVVAIENNAWKLAPGVESQ